MKSRKLIAFITAVSTAAAAVIGLGISSEAEDTETFYNFSELTEENYSKGGAEVFGGALTISGTENIVPQSVNAAVVSPLGETKNITSALKVKQLAVKLHLDAGETVVEYYCGTDRGAASGKNIDMLVKTAAGETVATETNTENSGVKPYVISYKAAEAGDYIISAPDSGSNRTMVYAVAKTTGEYTAPSGDVTPVPATQDPNATPAPTSTPRATVDPNGVADVNITRAQGWLETAYITWTDPTPVDYYNVYVKPEGGEYTKIDDELVRYYGSYYRADALGLKAGRYQMKVEPVIGGKAQDAKESDVMEVTAQIREGFAFDSHSAHYNPDGVGAYKNDGTLKDGAQIIYLTDANKDTVTAKVVTDSKGKETECQGLAAILSAREKGYADSTPLCIRMIGQVESPEGKNSSGYMQIKGTKNVTFEGVGDDACTYHWSFLIRNAENVEVRNLAVMEFYDDGISLDTDNFNCWVHNCDIFYGQNRGGDQKKGDGSLDVKSGSDYCTFSYNHFWDSGKSSLCGMKDDSYKGYHMTYHHNWFDHSDSRHPRVRGDQVHIYNNYYDGNSKYGAGACTGGSLFVEKNVFRNCVHPVLISMQGTDAKGEGTFSGEDGGNIKMFDNAIYGGYSVIYASEENTSDYDAYLAKTRDEQVPEKYVSKQGGNTYSNFDTVAEMYGYDPTDTDKVVDDVEKYAGRIENGDFVYEFDDTVDDASYDRNPVLGKLLEDYKTTLNTEYATGTEYPGTGGEQPTPRPTTEPFDPDTQPTPKPDGTGGDTGETESTVIWRASDTAANVTAGTALKDTWLTLIGGGLSYTSTKKTINGVAFTGKMNAPSGQSAPTLKENGLDGAALKFTPDADGKIMVYFKLNDKKTFYITDESGNKVSSHENTTGGSEYTTLAADVTAGNVYYAFGDGTNAEYWAAEYTFSGNYTDDDPDTTEPPTPTEPVEKPTDNPTQQPDKTEPPTPTEPTGTCVRITVEYNDNGTLKSVKADENIPVSEATDAVRTPVSLITYWDSLDSMKPVKKTN